MGGCSTCVRSLTVAMQVRSSLRVGICSIISANLMNQNSELLELRMSPAEMFSTIIIILAGI